MLKNRWSGLPWTSVTLNSRYHWPSATSCLSSQKVSVRAWPSSDSIAVSETMTVAAMRIVVIDTSGPSPRPLAKYLPAAFRSPVSLVSQPSRVAISALSSAGARRSASR